MYIPGVLWTQPLNRMPPVPLLHKIRSSWRPQRNDNGAAQAPGPNCALPWWLHRRRNWALSHDLGACNVSMEEFHCQFINLYIDVDAFRCICIHKYIYIYIYICVYIYICILHTHTHTCVCLCVCVRVCQFDPICWYPSFAPFFLWSCGTWRESDYLPLVIINHPR